MRTDSCNVFTLSLVIELVLLWQGLGALAPRPAHAQQRLPFFQGTSGIQVQNLDTNNTSTVSVTYYNQDGSSFSTMTDTLAANESKALIPPVPSDFNGSVTIMSNSQIAAIATLRDAATNTPAFYNGQGQSEDRIFMPQVFKNAFGQTTSFSIQNASDDTTTVEVAYSGQPACNDSASLDPNARVTLNVATNTCLPEGYNGAATISAGAPIVGVAVQQGETVLSAYNGIAPSQTGVTLYAPVFFSNSFDPAPLGVQIQNVGTTATTVTATYTPAPGFGPPEACTETATVPQGSSLSLTRSSSACMSPSFVGSVQITSVDEQPLAALVQVQFGDRMATYRGFNANQATDRVALPIVRFNENFLTEIHVQNAGEQAVNIVCTLANTTRTEQANDVLPGTSVVFFLVSEAGQSYDGPAVCAGTLSTRNPSGNASRLGAGSEVRIIAVVNQLGTDPGPGDLLATYEGVNIGVSTTPTVQADLAITLSDDSDPVETDSPLTYTITVANDGPDAAVDVVVTNDLPAEVTFDSAVSPQGNCSETDGTVTCNLAGLNAGATAMITLVVTPTRAVSLSNTVMVTAATADPNAANNSATETTTVQPCSATGDVDGLAGITSRDARLALQEFLNGGTLNACERARANVDASDGDAVTPADVLCIVQLFLVQLSCVN